MASTFTANAALEKIKDGEQENTWGATERTTLDEIDTLHCGVVDINMAGAIDVTLTRAQWLNPDITLSGAITANINLIVPTIEKPWFIENNTTGSFTITVKTSGGTGIVVPQGDGKRVRADGTNVVAKLPGISVGGTGASTAAAARTNLGVNGIGVLDAPAGTVMLFHQSAAPTGWTKDVASTLDNSALRVVTATAWAGGKQGSTNFDAVFGPAAATAQHTLTIAQMPSHTHDTNFTNDNLLGGVDRRDVLGGGSTHSGAALATGGGGSHNHTLSLDPNYINMIIATKD